MAAAVNFPGFMFVDEFLNWDAPGGCRWQLIDGSPVAMSPASTPHGIIQGEIGGRIWAHLNEHGGPCGVAVTPGVIPPVRSDRNFMIPDLGVTCSPADLVGRALHEPVLLIEILAPSNEAETPHNILAYQCIPALREILVIWTASIGVELLRRGDDDTWPETPLTMSNGTFTLSSIGLSVPVAALYRGTALTIGGD
jgi:Uma2 family endonuclease